MNLVGILNGNVVLPPSDMQELQYYKTLTWHGTYVNGGRIGK